MQIREEDYPGPGPNTIHYPFSPHPPPLDDWRLSVIDMANGVTVELNYKHV